MNQTHETTTQKKAEKAVKKTEDELQHVGEAVRDRVEQVRDVVEDVRDKAEVLFKERPYLVPVAAGTVGFGLGVLFGSKMMRFIAITAAGTIVTEMLGGSVRQIAKDLVGQLKAEIPSLDEGDDDAEANVDG